MPLALRAQALWEELARESQTDIFHRAGVLNLGPAGTTFITNAAAAVHKHALPGCQVLSAEEVRAKWPGVAAPNGYISVFEPQAGYLLSENAIEAFVRLAGKAGCTQLFGLPVTEIKHTTAKGSGRSSVEVVTADGQRHQGRKLLISAGTWVKKLLPDLPVTPVRKIFSWHEAEGAYYEDEGFPAFVVQLTDMTQYYGFPATAANGLKVGRHDSGQPIETHQQRLPFGAFNEDSTEVSGFLRCMLPGVGVPLRGAACTYDMSPDEDFIVDTLPENENVMFISGLSGHGFKFASALGEAAASFATGNEFDVDLSPFRMSRFNVETP